MEVAIITRNRLIFLNTMVVLLTTVVNAILGLFEIRLLINNYGSVVNGLIQSGNQILGYVSLIEAGIGSAFVYMMYKPIADKNYAQLSSYYCGFKISMRSVVEKMLIVAVFVSLVYPLFLKKDGLSYSFMFTIFLLLSIKMILPYLVTIVPKSMIIVSEQRYKAELISGTSKAFIYTVEILLLILTDLPLQVLLIASIINAMITGVVFKLVMNKLYGSYISKDAKPDMSPNSMSHDVMVHNISGLIFNSTDSIIISILGTLNDVTIYSNYNLISSQVSQISQSVFDGATASMAIKIAKKDENSYKVYREIWSGASFSASLVSSVFIIMINDFIEIWVGKEFCIGIIDCILFGIVLYCGMLFPALQVARNARGLYKESRNFTVVQAIVNIVITVVLVPFLGITGALIGTVVARCVITIPCNYLLIDKKVFPEHQSKWLELIIDMAIMFVAVAFELIVLDTIYLDKLVENIYIRFLLKSVISVTLSVIICYIYYWSKDRAFRSLIKRVVGMFSIR